MARVDIPARQILLTDTESNLKAKLEKGELGLISGTHKLLMKDSAGNFHTFVDESQIFSGSDSGLVPAAPSETPGIKFLNGAGNWVEVDISSALADYITEQNLSNIIIPIYDSTHSYSAGDFCLHEKALYKANKSTTGTFVANDWNPTNIIEILNEKITSLGKVLSYEGDATVSNLNNTASYKVDGHVYSLSDSGTLALHDSSWDGVVKIGDEVVWMTDKWIYLGNITDIDLSNYVDNEDLGDLVIDLYNQNKADYAVNDYVIYQKKLYRCKTANTANLPTNTTDWEKVNIIDTIDKKVNEHVPDLSDYVNNVDLGHLIVAVYTQKTYAVGDFCIYNKKFYQCSTAIGTAEVWTTAHWTEVTIMEVMDAKIGAIDLTPYLTEVDLGNVVATIWNKSTANTVGQYVIHDRKLYRCTSNTTAGADWDSSKWTEAKLTAIFQGSAPGLVPPATAADADRALKGDGTWGDVSSVTVSFDSVNEELHLDFSIANSNSSQAS